MSRNKSRKEKKVIQFKEVEEKVLISKEKKEVKDKYKTGIKNSLEIQNSLEAISLDKRKREQIVYEDCISKSRKIGKVQRKKDNNVLVEHWDSKENKENREEIKKCESCVSNREKHIKNIELGNQKEKSQM